MRAAALAIALLLAATLSFAGGGLAAGRPGVAALQVGLRSHGLYAGDIDGLAGPATAAAVRALQRRAGLTETGRPGSAVRRALGVYGRWGLGSRVLSVPAAGWDVAALQFALAWRGFPSGPIDGRYTERTEAAVRRFQRWAGLDVDGAAGPAVIGRLASAPPRPPRRLSPPTSAPVSGLFGPRRDRFHTGLDFAAGLGAPVAAAADGRVTYAAWHPGGWGYLVTVAHGGGLRTMYAHLSRIDVRVGQRVHGGDVLGAVGASGRSSGPHLHFEARVRGASVDPRPVLIR